MIYDICCYFLMFFIYSVVGYLVEVTCVSIDRKKWIFSRGYLIGPYLPIFGCGSMIITFFLQKYKCDPLALFVLATASCCVLEYFTSLILEKIFKLRWWDYSDKKFNLNGRICLETGALFGLGGVFIIEVFNPLITMLLNVFPEMLVIVLGIILLITIVADFCLSTYTIVKLKIDTSKYLNKDATRVVKEEVSKSLRRYRYFHNRLLKAFPLLSNDNNSFSVIKEIISKKHKRKNNNLNIENNKGFTLVELVVTIAILGIITVISFPLIRNIINNNDAKKFEQYSDILTEAASLYVDNYNEDLFCRKDTGCAYIKYSDLKKKNLIKDIQVDGVSCDTENTFIKVEKNKGNYKYTTYMGCVTKGTSDYQVILPEKATPHVIDTTACPVCWS